MEADFMVRPAQFLVSIWLLLVSCNAPIQKQKWYDAATLNLQTKTDVVCNDNQPFTGIIYALAENRKDTLAVVEFFDGKEHGHWRKYYATGNLAEERFYDHGVKTGTLTQWWENGIKKLEYHFANGEYEGPCREWNSKGALVSDMHYHKGYEEGTQTTFYDNGKVRANYVMTNGRRYGLLGTKNCVNVSDSIFKEK